MQRPRFKPSNCNTLVTGHMTAYWTLGKKKKKNSRNLTYFLSLCFGLGREYFRYPSQGTFLRPARNEIMSLTLHS